MLLLRGLVAIALLQPLLAAEWVPQPGALDAGNDIESGNYTVAEAEAHCGALHDCAGFTFKSNTSAPKDKVKVYFKTSQQGNTDKAWWTYLKPKAAFRFANTFGDHMVLQQNAKAQIWGFARPGDHVSVVSSAGGSASCVTGSEGVWQVAMPPVKGSMKPASITASLSPQSTAESAGTITLEDVLYGDVWFW